MQVSHPSFQDKEDLIFQWCKRNLFFLYLAENFYNCLMNLKNRRIWKIRKLNCILIFFEPLNFLVATLLREHDTIERFNENKNCFLMSLLLRMD